MSVNDMSGKELHNDRHLLTGVSGVLRTQLAALPHLHLYTEHRSRVGWSGTIQVADGGVKGSVTDLRCFPRFSEDKPSYHLIW